MNSEKMKLDRRALLKTGAAGLVARNSWGRQLATSIRPNLEVDKLDRQIWDEELEAFVPSKPLEYTRICPAGDSI